MSWAWFKMPEYEIRHAANIPKRNFNLTVFKATTQKKKCCESSLYYACFTLKLIANELNATADKWCITVLHGPSMFFYKGDRRTNLV